MSGIIVSDIKPRLPMPSGLDGIDQRKWRVLAESVFPNAKTSEAIVMAIDYCVARKLDPFKRPVNIVPMWNSSLGKEVETIWPGINEVQTTAARTGKYAGMDEPKWGKDVTRKFQGVRKYKDGSTWKEEEMSFELTYPEWCSVTVYRMVDGVRCAFTEPVFWEEAYAKAGKTDCPNNMWRTRPKGQLLKVAKAFSLRAAFPEEGEYTAEEMEGKEIQHGGIVIDQPVSITPSDTDLSKPKSPFKKAVDRNMFCRNVKESFQTAKTHAELTELQNLNKAKFDEMEASGAEADHLGLDDLRQTFKICWNRLIKPHENPEELDDRAPYPNEEIPAFIREMDEQLNAKLKY